MMQRKIYRSLVGVDEVLPIIESYRPLVPLGVVELPVSEAVGRVLAENVFSPLNYPPYTRALVDGYAVRSDDLVGVYEDRPRKLRLVGKVSTGETRLVTIGRGECVEVSTGAVVPYPADAVVPVEYTHQEGGEVTFYRSVARGENVDAAGSDVAEGEVVAWKGTQLTPTLAATLAALGVRTVKVYRPVRLGIVPTGNELRQPGEPLEYGQVYDSNSTMVYAYAKLAGAEPKVYPRARDELGEVEEALHRALDENDVVATIGGTSAGPEDLVYRALSRLDPGIILHGVREKPGRPLAVALHGEKIVFSLPGFPMSCLLTVNLYLLPVILRLQGMSPQQLPRRRAVIATPLRGEAGIRVFVPVILAERGGRQAAFPLPGHSGRVSSMVLVDGFAVVPENLEYAPEGSELEVVLNPFQRAYRVNIIGSHDPLLQSIVASIPEAGEVRVVNVGSLAGLQAVKSGVADIAGTHLLDPETGEYNVPYVKRLGIRDAVLVKGYKREQGFVYRKEVGPVSSFAEVIEGGYRFVNRNPGSGTRVLVDHLLEEEARGKGVDAAELKERLKGYSFEVKTHEAVAYLVSRGVADVGVAVRYVAERYGLGFTYLASEEYDLLVRKESLEKSAVKRIIEALRELSRRGDAGLKGYIVGPETGSIIEL